MKSEFSKDELQIIKSFFSDDEWNAIDSALDDYEHYGYIERKLSENIANKMHEMFKLTREL
tara:strand:- start:2250 stop:2432 length:183 start_codon:yes stop_codon:yes gene_type:complete